MSLFQRELGLFAIVEMNDLIADDLIRFMAFAGDDDDIIVAGVIDCARDRLTAVRHADVLPGAARAALDVVEDGLRLLGARVVARENRKVGQLYSDRAHLRTFLLVAIAAASEQHDNALF